MIYRYFVILAALSTVGFTTIRADESAEATIRQTFQAEAEEEAVVSQSQKFYTNSIAYQYTVDGWLQHVAIYQDCVICTNLEGPRQGVQFIIANNGAVLDMCHHYKDHKHHFTHKYPWGEVNTYETYQEVKIK